MCKKGEVGGGGRNNAEGMDGCLTAGQSCSIVQQHVTEIPF